MSRNIKCIDPRQGTTKRVLTVCTGNQLRSPTAAIVLSSPPYNFNVRSCGIDPGSAVCLIDDTMVGWAEEIVCFDKQHELAVRAMEGYRGQPVKCLNLIDAFNYRDPELMQQIAERYGTA